jgi:phosphatidylserine/phosphatidylglycerophosphate/cardiolipin synthase-like enzyme
MKHSAFIWTPFIIIGALGMALSVYAQDTQDQYPAVTLDEKVKFYFCPYQADQAESDILTMLASAHDSVIGNAYGFTDSAICDALVKDKATGVNVQLTMDATEAAGKAQKPLVKRLKDAGIEVLIGKSPVHNQLLHSKFFVVDGHQVEWGSLNYSPSGLQQFNTVSFADDPKLGALFAQYWTKIATYLRSKGK